jgi:hypothetical protein
MNINNGKKVTATSELLVVAVGIEDLRGCFLVEGCDRAISILLEVASLDHVLDTLCGLSIFQDLLIGLFQLPLQEVHPDLQVLSLIDHADVVLLVSDDLGLGASADDIRLQKINCGSLTGYKAE